MPIGDNFAQELFKSLKKASTATRKDNITTGGVSYSVNYSSKVVTGTFELPLLEKEDEVTGISGFEVVDFLEVDTTPSA